MKNTFRAVGALTILCLLLSCFSAATVHAQTAALTVQGILKKSDGSAVPDDVYTLRIALFDAEFGGTEVWFEVLDNVETNGGLYSAVLGINGKALDAPFDVPYYLSVKIGNSSQELLPRPRLSAAPYALSLLGADNIIPSTGNIQAYGLVATHGISADGLEAGSGGITSAGHINTQAGVLASTGPLNSGSGPFHGYGFLSDGTTGYGSNSYGVASIWAGGQNVLNATSDQVLIRPGEVDVISVNTTDVTINKLLKLPFGTPRTYTANQAGQTESTTYSQLYIGSPAVNTYNLPISNNYSLETSAVIKVGAIQAMSDRRVKKDFALSNPANDLALLQRIRITDYKYKDVIAKGAGLKKGVIAQELELLVPEAVGLGTDVIPDVYALAQNARLEGSALHLSMEKPHDLKVGDKVRLMAGDHQEDLPVQATPSATAFTVGGWTHGAPEKVFVYGREVNDFHSVDYDHLFTMNISATQELARRVESLEKENAAFKAQNDELRQLLEGLRADVETLKSLR